MRVRGSPGWKPATEPERPLEMGFRSSPSAATEFTASSCVHLQDHLLCLLPPPLQASLPECPRQRAAPPAWWHWSTMVVVLPRDPQPPDTRPVPAKQPLNSKYSCKPTQAPWKTAYK